MKYFGSKVIKFFKQIFGFSVIPMTKQNQSIDRLTDESSLTSSICSTLDSIQPPSLMNSLISMSERPSVPNSPKVSSRLECRHTAMNLSGKKGQKVPEMVRRALAISQGPDQDLSSSISSCQSNIDNIKPPTDMDSSILSIASISSEIAEMNNSTEGKLKSPKFKMCLSNSMFFPFRYFF